jgi:probable phosphomutase (TIGR03848 family)
VRYGPVSDILLIRHGLCDPVGRSIAGRLPGVHLNAVGRAQARRLADQLKTLPIGAVFASPLERARETAEPLAERLATGVEVVPGLTELDYGNWTGRTLDSLAGDPVWTSFNVQRGSTRIPGGESMAEVAGRCAAALGEIAARHPFGLAAVVTHGDVIRAVLATYMGLPLDGMLRLQVEPGSVSAVRLQGEAVILAVNWQPESIGDLSLG